MARYGGNEWPYALSIAEALASETTFRVWFLEQTIFRQHAVNARLMLEEQKSTRSKSSETWWRSYWTGSSYPYFADCGERETDLLAVFESKVDFRFALHIEVKAPGDRFGDNQARDYPRRAACWKGRDRAPRTVVPHDDATTVLCCPIAFAEKHKAEAAHFDTVVSHEQTATVLPAFPWPKVVP